MLSNSTTEKDNETVFFQELRDIIEHADFETIKKFLDDKGNNNNINIQDNDGNTALSIAVGIGNKEKITLLMKHGADIELTKTKLSKKEFSKLRRLYRQIEDTTKTCPQEVQTVQAKPQKPNSKRNANKELQKAVMNGNTQKVRSLLNNCNVDVNSRIKYSNDPKIAEYIAIIWAAEKGYREITSLLLNQPGIDINIKDSQGFTALMCAAEQGHKDIIELLLQEPSIDVNIENNEGANAMMLAIKNRHIEVIIQLLKHPDIDVNMKTINYARWKEYDDIVELLFHPEIDININEFENKKISSDSSMFIINSTSKYLLKTILEGDYSKARDLLENTPVDINEKLSIHEETILMQVAHLGNKKAVRFLLDQPNIDVNVGDGRGITALMCAAASGHDKIVKMLLDHGANVNIQDSSQKFSALMCASEKGHDEVVKMLLDQGAEVNVQGSRKQTPLMLAEYYGQNNKSMKIGHMKVIKLLLEHGADVNIRNDNNDTALMLVAAQGCEEVVELLLEHGADDDSKNISFMIAVKQGHKKVIEMLLKHGADVNYKGQFEVTPLLYAIENGYVEIVKILLKHGANVNVKDQFGVTPLVHAIRNEYTEIVKLLLENKADINTVDLQGMTPFLYAIESEDARIVSLLMNNQRIIDTGRLTYYGETLQSYVKSIRRQKIVKLIQSKIEPETQQVEQEEIKPVEAEEKIKPKQTKSIINKRFWEAVAQGDVNTLDSLLEEKDVDKETLINSKNKSGDTALIVSTRNGHINVMRSLLESQADLSLKDKKGDTALLIASDHGDIHAVKLLISNYADISLKDSKGDNALIRAAKRGHFDVVEELIHRGSTVNAQGYDNRTALMAAAEGGYVHVINLLIKKGAKVNIKDKYDKTAIDIVNEKLKNKKITSEYHSLEDITKILEKKKGESPLFEDLAMKTKLVDTWDTHSTNSFKKDMKSWQKDNLDIYGKIKKLIEEIKFDPYRGRGRPEPLKEDLKGLYSRKIDKENRILYEVDGEKVNLISCKGHYEREKRKCYNRVMVY